VADLRGPEINTNSAVEKTQAQSMLRYVIQLGNSTILYKSKRQKQTSRSSRQAELLPASDCLTDFLVIDNIKKEIMKDMKLFTKLEIENIS
jgi:hypothetical protein